MITFNELEQAVRAGQADQIIDAQYRRSLLLVSRLNLRKGLRAGHIPGSLNLPISDILDKITGKLKPTDELSELFAEAGLIMEQPAITTCGSGVTAVAGLTLALAMLGKNGRPAI